MNNNTQARNEGPCSGYKVVDLTSLVSGPYCSQVLADFGAEVIRIEAEGSDPSRHTPPVQVGVSAVIEHNNRGKKSVVVDLKSEAGITAVKELVRTADVFLQNSRPGVMERLGLDYETLRTINDQLIYASISGYGEGNPYSDLPAYDMVIQGKVGFMAHQGTPENPQAIVTPVADRVTAMWAANATVAALLHRERTGEGQKLVVSMLTAYASVVLPELMGPQTFVDGPRESLSIRAAYQPIATADGAVIGLIMEVKHFQRLCEALDRTDLMDDPRFGSPVGLVANVEELYREFEKRTRTMKTAELIAITEELGIPIGKVNTIEEFFEDEQVKGSNAYIEFEDPELGMVRHLNCPIDFEKYQVPVNRRAPMFGEHTESVLGITGDSKGQ